MAAVKQLNPRAELARAGQVMSINRTAAIGLQEVLRSNLGPKGTLKMLVSGAGDIKITKDGNVLLHEMQIQHPTATLIARVATAQDDITGDGTTSIVLLIGEMFKQADIFIEEGLHPRIIKEGFDLAKDKALEILERMKLPKPDRAALVNVARTSLSTKLHHELAEMLTEQIVDAVLTVKQDGKQLNLHMIEVVEMQHKSEMDTSLIKGLVLDHGGRHPDMKKRAENCYILTCNVSFEYEKTEVNAGLFYKSSEEREKMLSAERAYIDARVQKVIELKRKLCDGTDKNFVIINQKGIDPPSLDAFAKEGIIALRRAKRRNMERLPLVCGGVAVNSIEDLKPEELGHAGLVYEHVLGEDKYTFVEKCENPRSLTMLIKGPNKHTINQIKDAIKDGLMAVRNAIDDDCTFPGAGAFEIAAHGELMRFKETVKGRTKLGVQCFAEALLVIPKVLAQNAGYDAQETIVHLLEEAKTSKKPIGVDVNTGRACLPADLGILDNYNVKKQILTSSTTIATNLLLVDEIMKAGVSTRQRQQPEMAQ